VIKPNVDLRMLLPPRMDAQTQSMEANIVECIQNLRGSLRISGSYITAPTRLSDPHHSAAKQLHSIKTFMGESFDAMIASIYATRVTPVAVHSFFKSLHKVKITYIIEDVPTTVIAADGTTFNATRARIAREQILGSGRRRIDIDSEIRRHNIDVRHIDKVDQRPRFIVGSYGAVSIERLQLNAFMWCTAVDEYILRQLYASMITMIKDKKQKKKSGSKQKQLASRKRSRRDVQ